MERERVVVAEILRPRGNRGELCARSQTDVPGRLQGLRAAKVRLTDGSDLDVQLVEAWEHRDDWVLKFAGVDSITEAERFRGADLWVALAERGTLADGEWFQSDLLDCAVVDGPSGRVLGKVEGWQHYGGPSLMEVRVDGREVLIPFVPAICQVNIAERVVLVNMPDGLLEL
jgi:16S rRNA processing protein RimM